MVRLSSTFCPWQGGQNEIRGGLISSVRSHWGPTCRQQFNTRPCVDPAPGYELWVSSQSLARASFRKLVAPFAHSARRDECNFEETDRSIDVSGVMRCPLGLHQLDRSLSDPVIVVLGVFPGIALPTSPHALSAGLRLGPAHTSSYMKHRDDR